MDYLEKKELFRKFKDRELTDAELEEFLNLMQEGAFDADYDQIMSELSSEDSDHLTITNIESKQKVKEKLLDTIEPAPNTFRFNWLMKAASIAAILFLSIGAYRYYEDYQYKKLTQTFVTISVPQGKINTVTLQDGTKVTLSPGAIFKYPKAFGQHARNVELVKGRGFFDVSKDLTKPFTVTTDKLATTALGTSFVVQNFQDYGFEKISLYTGKVRVKETGSNKGSVILWPGQEFEKSDVNNNGLIKTFSLAKDAMTKGNLVFNQDRLDVALYNIADYYQVKLQFDAKIMKEEFINGKFEFKKIEDLLNSIAFTHQLTIKKSNPKTYQLMKKN